MKNITVLFTLVILLLGSPCLSSAYLCGTPQLADTKGHFRPFPADVDTMPPHLPNNLTAPALPAAPALPIGTQRTFFVPDFRSLQQYTVSAVLRGIGNFCYIFVEEAEWNTRVTAATVASIVHAFDVATPANPQQGIYSTLTEFFGLPPDIDENGRIILLLLNIQDANHTSQYTAGFFNPADQSRGVLRTPGFRGFPIRSNEADMLYIDTQPLNPNSEVAHNVIAHEFLHLIHWRHDPHEATWVDEGCAGYASFLCGYSVLEHVDAFEKTPSVSLIAWPETDTNALPHYGAAFLWMLYLHEQHGGTETLTEIVRNRGTSLTGIGDALALRGITRKIPDIFIDWKLANYLSDYHAVRLSLSPRRWHDSYPSGTQEGKLSNFSADYIGFEDAGGLTLGFSSNSGGTSSAAHAIEFHNTGDVRVSDIKLSTGNSGSVVLPSSVTEVILVPSLQTESINVDTHRTEYEYSAVRGAHITFITAALPNPVHPRYWDILAKPSESLVGSTLTVTLMLFDSKVERPYREAQAMSRIIQDGQGSYLYRLSFLLEPEIAPESVIYQISLDSRIVDTGSLSE
ncbi:MAG: hypothetical protein OXC79_04030 [Candidatus Poribacteria bacterium]|nr:hypothetical protein [Candidatus Poribacteria bacterium]